MRGKHSWKRKKRERQQGWIAVRHSNAALHLLFGGGIYVILFECRWNSVWMRLRMKEGRLLLLRVSIEKLLHIFILTNWTPCTRVSLSLCSCVSMEPPCVQNLNMPVWNNLLIACSYFDSCSNCWGSCDLTLLVSHVLLSELTSFSPWTGECLRISFA